MSGDVQHQGGPRRSYLGPRIVGIALLAFGVFVFIESFNIRQGGGYSAIGTQFFPRLVAIGLLALSIIFLLRVTLLGDTGLAEKAAEEEATSHWPTTGQIALALVLYPLALATLGYVVGTALFFPAAARILGSRRPWRDLIVGIGLGLVIYIGFTEFLGVRLPAGILDSLL